MQNGIHKHNCHICDEDYECQAVTHCNIEDKYAVCYSEACINFFESENEDEE